MWQGIAFFVSLALALAIPVGMILGGTGKQKFLAVLIMVAILIAGSVFPDYY